MNKTEEIGGGGIRTLGTLVTHTRFPSVLLRPLGHSSKGKKVMSSYLYKLLGNLDRI